MQQKIFDAHCHIGHFGKWQMRQRMIEPFQSREIVDVAALHQHMKKHKITKALVLPHYTPKQEDAFVGNAIVQQATGDKNVFGAFWVSPLPENTERTTTVLSQLPQKRIVALKMSPTSWPGKFYTPDPKTWDAMFRKNMEAILAAAQKHNLVLHLHTGSGNADPLQYVPFVEQYGKQVKMQFVHMGSSSGGVFAFVPRFIEWVNSGYLVYCDTAGTRGFGPAWLIKEAELRCPEALNRILFASDNPWGMFAAELAKITAIDCKEEIKRKILFENAGGLYG